MTSAAATTLSLIHISSNNGVYNLSVLFEPGSDTDIDQVLTNMRYGQASSQLPQDCLLYTSRKLSHIICPYTVTISGAYL